MIFSTCFFDEAFSKELANLERKQKYGLVRGFWPNFELAYDMFNEGSYEPFLHYVATELNHLRHHQQQFAIDNLEGTFHVISVLRQNPSKTQSEILSTLSSDFLNVNREQLQRSLELSVRLWLMFNINSSAVAVGPTFADELPLDWDHDVSLQELIRRRFPKSHRTEGRKAQSRIDPTMTAAFLANTCGVKLRWTDSISDHLRFDSTRQILTIYRHKICLANHLDSMEECPIPRSVLSEILDTLNLLFPFGDLNTKQLLIREHQHHLYQLGSCGRPRELDLTHYQYFREELEYLIETFNQPPRTWRQLATDRRNKLEWAAFWITVMVAILTLVSIPCSIIQTTYSVKAYRATLAQGSTQTTKEL